MISGAPGCLLWPVTAGGVLAEVDAVTRLEGSLAQALEANKQLTVLVERQRAELAARDAELEQVNAELSVLKRMLFGRSSERARPPASAGGGNSHKTATATAGVGRLVTGRAVIFRREVVVGTGTRRVMEAIVIVRPDGRLIMATYGAAKAG